MENKQAESILKIYTACAKPLYAVLENIPEAQLNWQPNTDSRSIGQMMRHLIRVDNWFLKRLDFEPEIEDPGEASTPAILAALQGVHQQIISILKAIRDDAELARKSSAPDAKSHETLAGIMIHISQHYLYHLAQMIYLRRAQDREWKSPMKQWEAATHIISDELAVIKNVES